MVVMSRGTCRYTSDAAPHPDKRGPPLPNSDVVYPSTLILPPRLEIDTVRVKRRLSENSIGPRR